MKITSGIRAIALLFIAIPLLSFSQESKTLFGFQFKPIIVSDIGDAGPFQVFHEDFTLDVKPTTGFAYGMLIRTDITENISLETGINQVQRKFDYHFEDPTFDVVRDVSYTMVNYELPVKGLMYIQLGQNTYMDGALGFALDLYASDVSSGTQDFRQETYRGQWAKVALEANIGVEYRTDRSGYFYFGSSFHNPFGEVARTLIRYEQVGKSHLFDFGLKTAYLTFDVRYFFPEKIESRSSKK